jgi:hypothetical protein
VEVGPASNPTIEPWSGTDTESEPQSLRPLEDSKSMSPMSGFSGLDPSDRKVVSHR